MKESKAGWTGFKIGPPRVPEKADGAPLRKARAATAGAQLLPAGGRAWTRRAAPAGPPPMERGSGNVSNAELNAIRQGFQNMREALGWDYDLMFHGGWNYDFFSSIAIAEALVPARVAWFEDPLPPNFSDLGQPHREVAGADSHRREPRPP